MTIEQISNAALRQMSRNRISALEFAVGVMNAESPEQRATNQALLSLRQMLGTPLPFSTTGADGLPSDFYVPSIRIYNAATACMQPATGNYYARYELDQPEGRHQRLYRILNEVLGCMEFMDLSVTREHAFALVAYLRDPRSDLDHLIRRLGSLLLSQPARKMTPETLVDVYETLLNGLSIDLASRLDGRVDVERQRAILESVCAYVYDGGSDRDHPLIRALLAAHTIHVMKPFLTINPIMARVVFSWAANELGLPIAGYSPVMSFLDEWSRNAVSKSEWDPGIPYAKAALKTESGGNDWSPWLEAVLRFLADDLDHFETRMLRLLMKRKRVESLIERLGDLNDRQRTILTELLLHDDAEFTYATVMEMFGVAYATAYADLGKLEAKGFAKAVPIRKATVFIAADDCRELFHRAVREAAPEEYARFYTEDGELAADYIARQPGILDEYKKSMPEQGKYVQIARPNLLPERCLVILAETDSKKR